MAPHLRYDSFLPQPKIKLGHFLASVPVPQHQHFPRIAHFYAKLLCPKSLCPFDDIQLLRQWLDYSTKSSTPQVSIYLLAFSSK